MASKRIEVGETGRTVAANVTRRRAELRMAVTELADRVQKCGRPLSRQAVTDIESGSRRVDVDDLVVLARALDTSPAALLMPTSYEPDEDVAITGLLGLTARTLWGWLRGHGELGDPTDYPDDDVPIVERDAAFRRTTWPAWAWLERRDAEKKEVGN